MPLAVLAVVTVLLLPLSAESREAVARIAALLRAEERCRGLEVRLLLEVIRIESGFDARALSPKGAMGLMQLMPATARRFGVRDPWDPAQNIRGGCAYLRLLVRRYGGDMGLVFAAYNAGEAAVDAHDGVPPYAETRAYVAALTGRPEGRRQRSVTATGRVVEWQERPRPRGVSFERPSRAGEW